MINKKLRRQGYNILALALALLLFIIAAEIICAALERDKTMLEFEEEYKKNYLIILSPTYHTGYQTSEIPGLVWEISPNLSKKDSASILSSVTYKTSSTNSLGMRDKEYNLTKGKETFRIIVLGDSVTEGFEVEPEEGYTEILEGNLNNASSRRYEVWNAAVGGYNTYQELLLFKHRFINYEPDLVIIARTWNDCGPTTIWFNGTDKVPLYKVPSILPLPKAADYFLILHSSFYRFLSEHAYNICHKIASNKYPLLIYKGDFSIEATLQNQNAIKEFVKLSRKHNFSLLLMLVPALYEENDTDLIKVSRDKWMRTVPEQEYGIKVLDLEPYFIKEGGSNLSRFRILPYDNIHLNTEGHNLTAEILGKYISQNYINA